MISVYEILKDLTKLAWDHKRDALEVLMALSLVLMYVKTQHAKTNLEAKAAQAQGLAANLRQQITIENGQISVLRRQNGRVIEKKIYVPPEGYVVVKQANQIQFKKKIADLEAKLKSALKNGNPLSATIIQHQIDQLNSVYKVGDVTYVIHNHGFCLRPGGRVGFADHHGLAVGMDLKFFFWNRFGVVFGGSGNGIGPGLSYHLDQMPYLHPKNLELFLNYNVIFNHGHPIEVGLRSDF